MEILITDAGHPKIEKVSTSVNNACRAFFRSRGQIEKRFNGQPLETKKC